MNATKKTDDARNREPMIGPDRPAITPELMAALSPLGIFEENGRLYAPVGSGSIWEVHPPCGGQSGHDDVMLFPLDGSIARSRLCPGDYAFENGGNQFRAAVRMAWIIAKEIRSNG